MKSLVMIVIRALMPALRHDMERAIRLATTRPDIPEGRNWLM